MPRKKYWILIFILLLLLFRYVGEIGPDKTAPPGLRVEKVLDGDTVDLTDSERLRLLGIDCPESGDAFYDSARSFLTALALKKNITVAYSQRRRDDYGRLLGYLYIDTIFANREILRQGLANLYLFEDNLGDKDRIKSLQEAQNEAMDFKRGIWSLPHRPEEFYVAARGSLRFHRPFCRSAGRLNKDKSIRFATREEAFRKGFSPCRNCRP